MKKKPKLEKYRIVRVGEKDAYCEDSEELKGKIILIDPNNIDDQNPGRFGGRISQPITLISGKEIHWFYEVYIEPVK